MVLKEAKKSKGFYSFQREREEEERKESGSFEKLLDEVGSEGRFQKFLIWGFMIPLSICNSLSSANTTLLFSTPDHSCHVPGKPENVTIEEWKNMTIPWEEDEILGPQRSSCYMLSTFPNEKYEDSYDNSTSIFGSLSNESTIECQNGWDFDNSSWIETPVSSFGWVCQEKNIVTTLFSLTYAGNAIGTFFFSILSDRCGRKPTFYLVLMLNLICSTASLFSPSVMVYGILKFCLSLVFYTLYQMPYIIVVELCSERLRSQTALFSFIGCVTGNCLVSLVAYLTAHWKIFILVCHLPSAFFLLLCRVVPESPRWLLSQSRVSECEDILKKVARLNGRSYSERSRRLLLEAQKEERAKKGSFRSFFASFVLVKHLCLSCILLSIGYVVYSGMTLNIHNMTGSKVLNFFVISFVEIPGNIVGSLCAQYLGRRASTVLLSVFFSGTCFLATLVLADEWLQAIVCALTKMFVAAFVLVVYMQIGELFNTSLRATAYGITGVVSLAAMILIPPLIAMGGSNAFLPYYILCGIGLLGSFLCTFLPETIGRPLPQTMHEAVSLSKNQSYFSCIHKWNAPKYYNTTKYQYTPRKVSASDFEDVVYRYDLVDN